MGCPLTAAPDAFGDTEAGVGCPLTAAAEAIGDTEAGVGCPLTAATEAIGDAEAGVGCPLAAEAERDGFTDPFNESNACPSNCLSSSELMISKREREEGVGIGSFAAEAVLVAAGDTDCWEAIFSFCGVEGRGWRSGISDSCGLGPLATGSALVVGIGALSP